MKEDILKIAQELEQRPELMELMRAALNIPGESRGEAIAEAVKAMPEDGEEMPEDKREFYRSMIGSYFSRIIEPGIKNSENKEVLEIYSVLRESFPSIQFESPLTWIIQAYIAGSEAALEAMTESK